MIELDARKLPQNKIAIALPSSTRSVNELALLLLADLRNIPLVILTKLLFLKQQVVR